MEDSNITKTSWNESFDANITYEHDNQNIEYLIQVFVVLSWIINCVGLLLALVAIFAVLSMVKKDHGAPVYVLNLLISDLLQLCTRITMGLAGSHGFLRCWFVIVFGFYASVGFMVCVSLERYLAIAKPLYYRFRRNIKIPVWVCVSVWILSFLFTLTIFLTVAEQTASTISGVVLLLPLPLFILFLIGTIKALSESRGVPADEKRRIVSILIVVLFTYALLFLPHIISLLIQGLAGITFHIVALILVSLNPLADSVLVILLRKSAFDKLLAHLCCCKMSNSQKVSNNDNSNTSALRAIEV